MHRRTGSLGQELHSSRIAGFGAFHSARSSTHDESLIRKQVDFKAGDLLDPRELANVERRIIDLGLFSRAVGHCVLVGHCLALCARQPG